MKRLWKVALSAVAAALLAALPASAQTTVTDQIPAPVPSTSNYNQGQSELLLQSYAISGGTIYTNMLRPAALGAQPVVSSVFVPVASGGLARYLKLTDAKSDLGVPMTAAAGTPSGTVGVSRTAGTSLVLVGETTSSNAKTDKALFETNLADSYIAGANIAVTLNANYTGSGTPTAATTTLTVAAYTEVNGVETALTVSAAQQFTGTATNYTFTITGTGLTPGERIAVEVVMLVTNASGGNTGQINSLSLLM